MLALGIFVSGILSILTPMCVTYGKQPLATNKITASHTNKTKSYAFCRRRPSIDRHPCTDGYRTGSNVSRLLSPSIIVGAIERAQFYCVAHLRRYYGWHNSRHRNIRCVAAKNRRLGVGVLLLRCHIHCVVSAICECSNIYIYIYSFVQITNFQNI